MAITINLVSEEKNLINNFLLSFFGKDMLTDENTTEWSYTLPSPLTSVELISAVMDNYNEGSITCWVSLDPNIFLKVREDNYNELIKYIFQRFGKTA